MSDWRKPNAEEAALGCVAICIAQENIRKYSKEQFIGRVPYLRTYRYTQAMLERRAAYTDDLPPFWTAPKDNSAAWLDYIETGKASAEVAKVLPTLGSCEVTGAA